MLVHPFVSLAQIPKCKNRVQVYPNYFIKYALIEYFNQQMLIYLALRYVPVSVRRKFG